MSEQCYVFLATGLQFSFVSESAIVSWDYDFFNDRGRVNLRCHFY